MSNKKTKATIKETKGATKRGRAKKTSDKIKISRLVSLPINKYLKRETKEFVPEGIDFKDNKRVLEHVSVAIKERMPVLLIGETGSGKTSLIRHLAHKTNNAFRRVNHSGGTTYEDIVGRTLINEQGTYWVDGVLVEAMRKGYWYLADEINASSAEVNFIYHSLLDDDGYVVLPENDGEIVRPHPDFRFFGAMNPSHDYEGTKELNKALISRFIVIKTDFPDPGTEKDILKERAGVKDEVAEKMVEFAVEIRGLHAKGKSEYVLSTRDLIMWAKMFKIYGKYIVSAEMTVLNKTNEDDLEAIKDNLSLKFKGLDEGGSKKKRKKGDESGGKSLLEEGDVVKLKDYDTHADWKDHDGKEGVVILDNKKIEELVPDSDKGKEFIGIDWKGCSCISIVSVDEKDNIVKVK